MNKILSFTLLTVLGMTLNAQADTLVLLSPYQTKADAQQQVVTTIELLTKMPLGENITVLNGEDATTIATLSVPDDERLQSYNDRIRHNAVAIATLGQFTRRASLNNRLAGAMNLIFTLGEIARYHRGAEDILVMGSGLFDIEGISQAVIDADEMLVDSNISQSPQQSTFGTKGIEEKLKGFRIHWLLNAPIKDTTYKDSVQRFWHLWLHHQSAELVSFTTDKISVLRQLKTKADSLPMVYELKPIPQKTQPSKTPANTMLFALPLSAKTLDATAWQHPQKLRLGIRWEGSGIDLDVYASTSNTPPVYFANPSTTAARHFKDVRSGSGDSKTTLYETITFHRPVDLCRLVIGINHYGGAISTPVHGTLRTEIGSKVYETAFTLQSPQGNRGADMRHVMTTGRNSAFSKKFRIADIVDASNQHKQACNV